MATATLDWSDCPLVEVIPGKGQQRTAAQKHPLASGRHHWEL